MSTSGKRLLLFLTVQEIFWSSDLVGFSSSNGNVAVLAQEDCSITNDLFSDSCLFVFDGECDATEGGVCPSGSDCFDCHGCTVHNLDCASCIANGCFWCPTDATCQSQSLGAQVWETIQSKFTRAKVSVCEQDDSWVQTCETNPNNVYSDPLYSAQQWAYDMMRVEPVWKEGFTGKGVVVRVNDPDGVDATHPELSPKFDEAASCADYSPPGVNEDEVHGTAVASLAVGAGNNNLCAVGIAPDATLSACVGPTSLSDEDAARFFLDGLDNTHVSINSWGFDACGRKAAEGQQRRRFLQTTNCPFVSQDTSVNPCSVCPDLTSPECEAVIIAYCVENYQTELLGCAEYLDLFVTCGYNVLSDVGQDAITKGVQEGRDGKGIIYLFAAGNELDVFEDVNMEGWLNSRFTITVGAVGKDETHASYSTPGSALFISGPGGDRNDTTSNIVAAPGGGCADATIGTSFATPSVAGAVALVLEANPSLGWRDVQSILAATARKIDKDHSSWTTNGARMHHSTLYGFGMMDARAAVEAAKLWTNIGPEKQIMVESGEIGVDIADSAAQPADWSLSVRGTGSFSVESVVVYIQLEHESRGDLEITLTSPAGTDSVLHPGNRPENSHLTSAERWKLMTVRNFGEYPVGEWTLTFKDLRPGRLSDCINFDFLYTETQGEETIVVNCETIESSGVCGNGSVLDEVVDTVTDTASDRTGRDACCICGGGRAASSVNNLRSWRLVIYGAGDFQEFGAPTEAPSGGGAWQRTIGALTTLSFALIVSWIPHVLL